jgi:hypothetical protein
MKEALYGILVRRPKPEQHIAPSRQQMALSPIPKEHGAILRPTETSYYWIEYRADEDRFVYVQQDFSAPGLFGRRELVGSTEHHTKNDLDGSMEILEGIRRRSVAMGYDVSVFLDRPQIAAMSLSAREWRPAEPQPRPPRKPEKERPQPLFLTDTDKDE